MTTITQSGFSAAIGPSLWTFFKEQFRSVHEEELVANFLHVLRILLVQR